MKALHTSQPRTAPCGGLLAFGAGARRIGAANGPLARPFAAS
jgi:hypothetical protein